MQYKTVVRVEHLNHNQRLFGGYMLLWVDEYAYIAAMEEFPGGKFVTRAIETAVFSQGVLLGSILTFDINRVHIGHTSVTYSVNVTATELNTGHKRPVFNTNVTLCNTDGKGNKAPLPPLLA